MEKIKHECGCQAAAGFGGDPCWVDSDECKYSEVLEAVDYWRNAVKNTKPYYRVMLDGTDNVEWWCRVCDQYMAHADDCAWVKARDSA